MLQWNNYSDCAKWKLPYRKRKQSVWSCCNIEEKFGVFPETWSFGVAFVMLPQFTGLRHHPSLWVVVPDVSRSIENIYYIQRNICMYLQILFLEENRLYKIAINKHFTKLKRNHIDLFVGLDLEWTFKLFVVVDIDQRYCWWFKIHKYANWLGLSGPWLLSDLHIPR